MHLSIELGFNMLVLFPNFHPTLVLSLLASLLQVCIEPLSRSGIGLGTNEQVREDPVLWKVVW